jgi:hypothetical protein
VYAADARLSHFSLTLTHAGLAGLGCSVCGGGEFTPNFGEIYAVQLFTPVPLRNRTLALITRPAVESIA